MTPRSRRRLLRWLVPVLVPLLMAVTLRLVVAEVYRIHSTSMVPSLLPGDRVLVNRLAYRKHIPPQRGDVVVFSARLPGESRRDFIKRVIGVPGDVVEMVDGVLQVNGRKWSREPEAEANLDASGELKPPGLSPAEFEVAVEHSPQGSWRVLRSRAQGLGSEGSWTVRPNHLLVMGDNRDDSIDGRSAAGYGQIPIEALVGRAERVVWSRGANGLRKARLWLSLRSPVVAEVSDERP